MAVVTWRSLKGIHLAGGWGWCDFDADAPRGDEGETTFVDEGGGAGAGVFGFEAVVETEAFDVARSAGVVAVGGDATILDNGPDQKREDENTIFCLLVWIVKALGGWKLTAVHRRGRR